MADIIDDYLRTEAQRWVTQFVQDRVAFLRSRNIAATGELINSMQSEVTAGLRGEAVQILIAFEEYGRIVDMRKFNPPQGGGDYIAALEEWIQRKGLAAKFTTKYVNTRNLKSPPERVLTYIAWGIAKKRFNGKYRRRRWYNRSKSAAITELFRDVAANMPELVAQEIKSRMASPITKTT